MKAVNGRQHLPCFLMSKFFHGSSASPNWLCEAAQQQMDDFKYPKTSSCSHLSVTCDIHLNIWNIERSCDSVTKLNSPQKSNEEPLTGISTLQSSPPILQFICKAIFVAMAITVCGLLKVRASTHWLGVGQSVHKYFLIASYLSLRLLDRRQTTFKGGRKSLQWSCHY